MLNRQPHKHFLTVSFTYLPTSTFRKFLNHINLYNNQRRRQAALLSAFQPSRMSRNQRMLASNNTWAVFQAILITWRSSIISTSRYENGDVRCIKFDWLEWLDKTESPKRLGNLVVVAKQMFVDLSQKRL